MNYETIINGLRVSAHYSQRSIDEIFLPLLHRLTAMQREKGSRLLVMLAAPPAAGKSTLLSFLQQLSRTTPGVTPITAIGMDGFHRYQSYLLSHTLERDGEVLRMVDVKGCPETFDLAKLTDAVARVAAGECCGWPSYDRLLHNPVENAQTVTGEIVVLEGNYLLLDRPGWRELHRYADYTIKITAEEADLRQRLIERKAASGASVEEAVHFAEFSDLHNARLCLRYSLLADLTLKMNSDGEYTTPMLFTDEAHNCFAKDPAVVKLNGTYYLYYSMASVRHDGAVNTGMNNAQARFGIGIAQSSDLTHWQIIGAVPETQPCEEKGIAAPGAVVLDGKVHLFYQTYGNGPKDAICHAVSADGIHFEKDGTNPVFSPTPDWCNGRAIDADVCVFQNKLFLYFATRDHKGEVQKIGGAWAELGSDFSRDSWHQIARGTLIAPEMQWEGQCTEAAATIVNRGQLFLFYGGSYNCTPQQIGVAVSDDGCFFRKLSPNPILPCGTPHSWHSSESGHPFAFRDDDGRAYLFHQGSADNGKTWYLSKREIRFDEENVPYLVE